MRAAVSAPINAEREVVDGVSNMAGLARTRAWLAVEAACAPTTAPEGGRNVECLVMKSP